MYDSYVVLSDGLVLRSLSVKPEIVGSNLTNETKLANLKFYMYHVWKCSQITEISA